MPLTVESLAIPEVKLITPVKHQDHRGFFSESWNARTLAEHGISTAFVQDNHAFSVAPGTIRGLHFQTPPHGQTKLIRVSRGAIFDVAVDLRRSSPTYGQHVTAVLSAENWTQILIPEGFAHGLCTLEPNTEVLYKVDGYFAPDNDKGVRWDDPDLGVVWPDCADPETLSGKDKVQPLFKDMPPVFP